MSITTEDVLEVVILSTYRLVIALNLSIMINKKKKRVPFTPSEDEVIIKFVKDYPTNLKKGFIEASKQLSNRSWKIISVRWYTILKKRKHVNAITCGSSKGFTKNVKNLKCDKNGNLPEQELRAIDYVMKEILGLSLKDRRKIINFLK